MDIQGTVHKYGDNADTDVIILARYLNASSHRELARYCMVNIDVDFVNRARPRDIIVANEDFGCGFSREHVPIVIKASRIFRMITSTFARVFYRNSVNTGLPILECEKAAREIRASDEASVDFNTGVTRDLTTDKTYQAQPFPPFIQNTISKDGLLNSVANP